MHTYLFQAPTKSSRAAAHDSGPKAQRRRAAAPVIQLKRLEPKGIGGLTHLVEMTEGGSLFHAGGWRQNERNEVKTGDRLLVDMDNAVRSRRGINQEENSQRDAAAGPRHLWLGAVELNAQALEDGLYVRHEMLTEGWPGYQEGPKTIHSIWVQGDPMGNAEARAGLETRTGPRTEGWVNMIWLYNTGVSSQSDRAAEDSGLRAGVIPGLEFRDFKKEMAFWKSSGRMPAWVDKWLPILDILNAKKSFVTMSDLMRMIILYYEGGLYMDIKIKVPPQRSAFLDKPMLQVNTANFYDRENWAIMATAGSRMIEQLMTTALAQFPRIEELEQYTVNYQKGPEGGEGRMHVELHERRGVWNAIERADRPGYGTGVKLVNPRPLNSWTTSYDDRPQQDIEADNARHRQEKRAYFERKITDKQRELSHLEEQLKMSVREDFWKMLGLDKDKVAKLPGQIQKVREEIQGLDKEKSQWT